MKKSILFFLLIGMTLLNSCETQETVLTEQNNTTPNYNTAILDFFTNYKASLSNNKEKTKKISALMQAIDYSSIKQYDLKTTEKLLVIDLKEFNFTPNATNNKLILFVNNNKIARARLVNFECQDTFNQYDALIVSILNMDKTKLNYTGRVNQFDIIQNKEFSNVFADGKLIENGATKNKVLNSIAAKGDCIDWYWITTYSDGRQTEEYLYTTCDPCEALLDKSANCGGGSGGASSSASNSGPTFPKTPYNEQKISYTSPDGVYTEYQYDEKTNTWVIVINILPDIVVRRNPDIYTNFVVVWPYMDKKVVSDGLIYTYDASGTGNWEGVPFQDRQPCADPVVTSISKVNNYMSAVSNILSASADGHEHSITLGKDSNGNITQAPMNNGGVANVLTNTSWTGAFGAIHNHPNNTPISAGDIYASVALNIKSNNFTTTFVLTNGEVYAAVVTDFSAAQAFVAAYPADQLPGYNPEFPDFIYNQLQDLVTYMGSTIEGRTSAIAFILDKYNAGITLLKQNSNGNFNFINTEEVTQNGIKTYILKPCN